MPFSSVLGASSVIKPGVATSTTRPSAPYIGQLIFETDTNRLVVYTSSGWVYQTAAAAPPGLVYLTGASFSAVSSVSFPNNTFTSTYRNYKIIFETSTVSVDTATIQMRLRVSGSDISTSTYLGNTFGQNYSSVNGNNVSSNATSFNLGISRQGTTSYSFDIYAPQVSTLTAWSGTGYGNPNNSQGPYVLAGQGGASNTQADALTFFMSSGTLTGNYRVYGYADS